MKIIVNGNLISINHPVSLLELLKDLNYSNQKIAVELNNEIIPRSSYANRIIVAEDRIEIIIAVGGG